MFKLILTLATVASLTQAAPTVAPVGCTKADMVDRWVFRAVGITKVKEGGKSGRRRLDTIEEEDDTEEDEGFFGSLRRLLKAKKPKKPKMVEVAFGQSTFVFYFTLHENLLYRN
jgi:hypothetical protein